MNAQRTLAPALGWFSIALGAVELAAPRQVARAIGTHDGATVLRAFGAREIGTGVAVLSRRNPSRGLWMRVAGDALDLGALIVAGRDERNDRGRLNVALGAVAAVTVADVFAAIATSGDRAQTGGKNAPIVKTVSLMASQEAVFERLSEPGLLQRIVPGLEKADVTLGDNTPPSSLHYLVAAGPFSGTLDVTLSDGGYDRGTVLRLEGSPKASGLLAKALGMAAEIPGDMIAVGLHRLKNLVEVGEVVSAAGPSGRGPTKGIG